MRLGKSLGLATGLLFATAVSASAITWATSVETTTAGAGFGTDPARSMTANALGAPDGAFYSPGIGGSITVSFGTQFVEPGAVYEVTLGNPGGWPESADIYVSNSLADLLGGGVVASVGNAAAASGATFNFAGVWTYMTLVDTSNPAVSGEHVGLVADGFDLDAIGVTPVPVPASALLLGAALAGLGVARRKS